MVTVIPEGDNYEFLGWATPGFNKFSISKNFPLFLMPEQRSILLMLTITGKKEPSWDQDNTKSPSHGHPSRLPAEKAVLAEDLDKMEQLGMYEVVPEDMAFMRVRLYL